MENLHPLYAGFPPVLWTVALGFLLLGAAGRRPTVLTAGRWLLHLATFSAVVASISGLWAARGLGAHPPGGALVLLHRDWMLAATSVSVIASAALIFLQERTDAVARWIPVLVAAAAWTVGALGADRGGLLVYGFGTGTRLAGPSAEAPHAPGETPRPDPTKQEP